MEQSDRKEHILDLESGLAYSAEQDSKVTLSDNGEINKAPGKVWSGFVKLDGSVKGIDAVNFCKNATYAPNIQVGNPELFTTKKLGEAKPHSMEKGRGKEKSRKPSSKKPSKPPRPPKARILDAADQKLVQQIAQLAMLKKARVERMKALKRMKANKGSSSSGSLLAMIITILFCLVVLLEGVFPQNSSGVKFQGSPVPAMAREPALISVQFNNNDSAGSTAFSASPRDQLQVEMNQASETLDKAVPFDGEFSFRRQSKLVQFCCTSLETTVAEGCHCLFFGNFCICTEFSSG